MTEDAALSNMRVTGLDSTQAAVFHDEIYFFFGQAGSARDGH